MRYEYLDRTPEELIEASELPTESGIAVAVRTTGFEIGTDEVVEIAIVRLSGEVLFHEHVKPQNVEGFEESENPELYQFEDAIAGLYDGAEIVVAEHAAFAHEIIESSWVSLPDKREFDLVEQFCASHCTDDYPGHPATVASLEGIADYFGLSFTENGGDVVAQAQLVASCYAKLVAEHVAERASKPAEYWEKHERERAEAEASDAKAQVAKRNQELKTLRVNAIMWLCAAAIFSNLAVQLHIRAVDTGFVIFVAAVAIFTAIRWIQCLYRIYRLRSS